MPYIGQPFPAGERSGAVGRLDELAAEEHISKSALLLQGAELLLQRRGRSRDISAGMDFVMSHDADLLKRLEDA
ncbi:MAG: hypothetical protein ABI568_07075 [Pseudarthrobacter sp.]